MAFKLPSTFLYREGTHNGFAFHLVEYPQHPTGISAGKTDLHNATVEIYRALGGGWN